MSSSRLGALPWVLTACMIFAGCDAWNRAKEPAERPDGTLGKDTLEPQPSIANQGTVGERCFVQGVRLMRVKGYSLVIGLGGTGSPQCPTSIPTATIGSLVPGSRTFHESPVQYRD